MHEAISKDIKLLTNKSSKNCYKAINRLMHYKSAKSEILEQIKTRKAKDQQREFQLFIAYSAVNGDLENIGKYWDRFEGSGSLKKEFLEVSSTIKENYWPTVFYVMADALECKDFLMDNDEGVRQVRHFILPQINHYLKFYGHCVLEYFEKPIKKTMLNLLLEKQCYLEDAVAISKYYFNKKDTKILEALYSLLPDSGKPNVVTIEVFNQNSKEFNQSMVKDHEYLDIDKVVFSDKSFSDYKKEKTMDSKNSGSVVFSPTGLIDKSVVIDSIKTIESNS